jgi:hypothetical protein
MVSLMRRFNARTASRFVLPSAILRRGAWLIEARKTQMASITAGH